MRKAARSVALLTVALVISPFVIATAKQTQISTASSAQKQRGQAVVAGAVLRPTRIILARRVRLLEAITVTGGLTKGAKGLIQVLHADGTSNTYRLKDLKRDDGKTSPYLKPNDVVSVR